MNIRSAFLAGTAAVAILSDAGLAYAQEKANSNGTDKDIVVVTARRKVERLIDVPASVSVVSAQTLNDRGGVSSVKSLVEGQAGVRFYDSTSPTNSEISMRGSPTARATSSDPAVGLYRSSSYVGGGAIGGRSFAKMDLFDVGRVEVMRGTQGALYGRNAVGGAINIVSALPEYGSNKGSIDAKYTSETEGKQLQATQNIALGENTSIRLGYDYIKQDKGFFYNPDNDTYFDIYDGSGYRAQLRHKMSNWDVNILHESQDYRVPAIMYRVYIDPNATSGFPNGYYQPQYSYGWNFKPYAYQKQTTDILTLSGLYPWGMIISNTMYRDRETYYQFDGDGINVTDYNAGRANGTFTRALDPSVSSQNIDKTKTFSQNLQFNGTFLEEKLDWLVGFEYLKLESDSSVTTGRTPTQANPSTGARAPATVDYSSSAIFGSLGYKITPKWDVSYEGRYTADKKQVIARRYDLLTGAQTGGSAFNIDSELTPTNFSYNFVTSYKLMPRLTGYAKIGTAYRSGGFNTNLGDPRQPVTIPASYENEETTAYELGFRGRLFERISFATAYYKNEIDNLIVQTDNGCRATNPVCPITATSFLTNAGKAEASGIELELSSIFKLFGGNLKLDINGSKQDGEVTEGQYTGSKLPQAPEWIAGFDIHYNHRVTEAVDGFFHIDYNGHWGGQQELVPPLFALKDLQIVNARIGAKFNGYEIAYFANNIFDSVEVIYQSTTAKRYNQPFTSGIQLVKRW
jgi:iron complex outermembrane receptor protein